MNSCYVARASFVSRLNTFHQRIIVLVLCALSTAGTSITNAQTSIEQQREESTAQTTPRKASVRGRVIYEDTRRPLRRVQLYIFDPASKSRRHLMAWTDGRGEFQFRNVPVGKYFVNVDAPGIIRESYFNPDNPNKEPTIINIDGSTQSDVVVRVKRGGAVSGKVTYADGDPVMNATIQAFLKKDGKWVPLNVGGPSTDRALTDERGVYRISGLIPGEYLIGAAEQKMGVELTARDSEMGTLLNRSVLPATYYDGVTNLSGATALRVQSGDEQTNINITLIERQPHSISGMVTITRENLPVARARLSLRRKDAEIAGNSMLEDPVVNSDEEGRFIFDEVYEGVYTLTVTPPEERYDYNDQIPSRPTVTVKKFVPKRMELNLAGTDLTNVNIVVSSGRSVSGVVTVDAGKSLPRNVYVVLEPAEGEGRDRPSVATQQDGTFKVDAVPAGTYYVRTSVPPNGGYYTKSVTREKTDLTREPLVISEEQDLANLQIVISSDVAVLTGRLLGPDGKSPKPGVTIVFVSADSGEQKSMSRRLYAFTNPDGGFRVTGAPGEYAAIIMPGFNQLSGSEIAARAAKAQRVTLQAGENPRIDLVVPNEK